MSVERHLFPTATRHDVLRRLLLTLDGSTTRACEAIAEQPMQLLVHHQQQTTDVPAAVQGELGGSAWLERVTSLVSDEGVMMDNLSFTRLDAVPPWFLDEMRIGTAPVGHLLAKLFVRREPLPIDAAVAEHLWRRVGLPDAHASRAYRIVTDAGPVMLIFEVFRGGMVRNSESR
jgi:chorismate-pyruvate lyase